MDYGALTSAALKLICQQLKLSGKWDGPEITADRGSYKVDWRQGDDLITLYDDGVVQHYKDDSQSGEITITPLHEKEWVSKLTEQQVPPEVAVFAVDFFCELRNT